MTDEDSKRKELKGLEKEIDQAIDSLFVEKASQKEQAQRAGVSATPDDLRPDTERQAEAHEPEAGVSRSAEKEPRAANERYLEPNIRSNTWRLVDRAEDSTSRDIVVKELPPVLLCWDSKLQSFHSGLCFVHRRNT